MHEATRLWLGGAGVSRLERLAGDGQAARAPIIAADNLVTAGTLGVPPMRELPAPLKHPDGLNRLPIAYRAPG